MITECTIKARARRVAALEAIELRRAQSETSTDGSNRHPGAASFAFSSNRAQPVFAPVN